MLMYLCIEPLDGCTSLMGFRDALAGEMAELIGYVCDGTTLAASGEMRGSSHGNHVAQTRMIRLQPLASIHVSAGERPTPGFPIPRSSAVIHLKQICVSAAQHHSKFCHHHEAFPRSPHPPLSFAFAWQRVRSARASQDGPICFCAAPSFTPPPGRTPPRSFVTNRRVMGSASPVT